MKMCPVCKKNYGDEEDYCEDCGAKLVEDKGNVSQVSEQPSSVQSVPFGSTSQPGKQRYKCEKCGWEGETDEDYCPQCGAKLGVVVSAGKVMSSASSTIEKLILPDSTEIKIDAYPFQFGRSMLSNYPDSDTVSRRHFIITLTEANGQRTYEIEDSNSLNGTSLNGKVIGYDNKSNGKFPLKDGDKISLCVDPSTGKGIFELTFKVIHNNQDKT
ncbi:MAG: FHA domain-containing protein [Candidatus Micrarchaeaceae archaeon]